MNELFLLNPNLEVTMCFKYFRLWLCYHTVDVLFVKLGITTRRKEICYER
jgi:hypothetical protein